MPLSKNEIKFIRSLQQKKIRDQENLFIVEGVKLVNELLQQDKFTTHSIYCTEDAQLSGSNGAEISIIGNKDLERISGFKTPNQVLAIVHQNPKQAIDFETENLSLILDNINDPGNLGTIIRTADWFGINQIICSKNSVDMLNPKVVQATMGAIFRVSVFYEDLAAVIDKFSVANYDILAADMDGEDALNKKYLKKSVLIMGSESHGISEELVKLASKISIPSFGKTESLNVAMATGIICSNYARTISID